MADVQTTTGVRRPEALGHCQMHEHIFVRPTPMSRSNPALCIDDFERSLAELRRYRAAGGSSLVDAQPVGAGRDAVQLERLSAESGVAIIASTGYHLLDFYPADSWLHALDEDALTAVYRDELTVGMLPWLDEAGARPLMPTAIRAGMVKAAIPAEGPVGRYAVLLSAAARAAASGGVPLLLHTERGQKALDAVALCREKGLAPHRILVCHADRQAADWSPHEVLAEAGVFLDYDTIGRFRYHSDADEVALLRHMVERGFARQLLLALDTTAARLTAYGGDIGLTYLFDVFLPLLRREGFDEATLNLFCADNARRLFSQLDPPAVG